MVFTFIYVQLAKINNRALRIQTRQSCKKLSENAKWRRFQGRRVKEIAEDRTELSRALLKNSKIRLYFFRCLLGKN
ncbi:hypothetical protein M5D96_008175 [Drosophila gunungcola]|uniref:Uncharacterized protein n=1 Tax=Drosophila gunungcola TaxID=103775 RepID=A0A9P9YM54_9MUSC|nr:hypothetical protein M5D96_008175 [Drosophila gunungcola]